MVISRMSALGIKVIDLLIATGTLILITGSVIATGDTVQILALDFLSLIILVFGTYLGIALIIGILCTTISTDAWIGRMAKVAISGLLMILLFPVVIDGLMWILQYQVSANSANILFWATLIRTLVRTILGKYWETQVV